MTACAPASYNIFLGDDAPMYLRVNYPGQNGEPLGDPVDLTTCTEIVVSFPNADGTFAQLTLTDNQVTIENAVLGKYSVQISSAVSQLFQVGPLQTFTVQFTFADGLIKSVDYPQGLTVLEPRPF